MNELITTVNDIIWSYVLMVALVGCFGCGLLS